MSEKYTYSMYTMMYWKHTSHFQSVKIVFMTESILHNNVLFKAYKMSCDLKWWEMIWSAVVWCDVVWRGVVWCDVMLYDVVWYDVMWFGLVWCGVVWCDVVWYGVVWCDVVWHGVVWYGVVWYDVVWCECYVIWVNKKLKQDWEIMSKCEKTKKESFYYNRIWTSDHMITNPILFQLS